MVCRTLIIYAVLAAAIPTAVAVGQVGAGDRQLWQPYYITPRAAQTQHITLDGEWQLSWRDAPVKGVDELGGQGKWLPTQASTSVHWALYRANELPHPYHNLNSEKYEWVDEKVWYYRKTFATPQNAAGNYAMLCFDGIDYHARVWLNGQALGRHEGMFGGPTIEVGELLRGDDRPNELVVEVRAGNYGRKKDWSARKLGPIIRPWIISRGNGAEMYFPVGIWQGVRLEIVPRVHLERPFLVTRGATDKEARLSLSLEVFANAHSLQSELHSWKERQLADYRNTHTSVPVRRPLTMRVELTTKDAARPAFSRNFPLQIYEGHNWVRQELILPDPRRWYPNGMGEPHRYRVGVTLLEEDREIDRVDFDYGVRTLEMRPSAGAQSQSRWADWQFVINGRPLFVKGINWTMSDILLDTAPERYRWLLEAARHAGIQMIRVNGAFLIETDEFYRLCDELGIMVWQDFPIGNQDTPEFPQQVWEAQVVQNIFRLRNHPSLALWCGGNEFNPYSPGNAATIGILERALAEFDPTRPFRRATPDAGGLHTYPDMDPTWYGKIYKLVPWIAETGMHNIPEAQSMREVVDPRETAGPLANMYSQEFADAHPEFRHHFVEFNPDRLPRMLSRASHIDDMRAPSLEAIAEASQIGAGEFYQVMSDEVQANYPVTTGLLPWVLQRPYPAVAIMLIDGFGQPTAPYYFLKRTYEPTHVMLRLPHLLWAPGETVPLTANVVHAAPSDLAGATVKTQIYDRAFKVRQEAQKTIDVKAGPSVGALELGAFTVPAETEDNFFFLKVELIDRGGRLVSRSVYFPRSLRSMTDAAFRTKQRESRQPWPTFDQGPWLKPQIARAPTTLVLDGAEHQPNGEDRSRVKIRVRNTGAVPAFPVHIDVEGAKRAFRASDNFFWLGPGEERQLDAEILWREPDRRRGARLTVKAWNAGVKEAALK